MSDPENFVARWSRRKHAAAQERDEKQAGARAEVEAPDQAAGDAASTLEAATPPVVPAFDIESLPPIGSITAESDIRPFLAPGVPPELTRAALRRAWAIDPKIRDFVGLADYDWDFNTPGAITGFGALEMSDEVRREMLRMVGRSLVAAADEEPLPTSAPHAEQPSIETSGESAAAAETPSSVRGPSVGGQPKDQSMTNKNELYNSRTDSPRERADTALQDGSKLPDNDHSIVKRTHGKALPH
jgi:Protein of unknown function (DUF3306)